MFRDDYKRQMDKITPDTETREKILKTLEEDAPAPIKSVREKNASVKRMMRPLRAGFALAACLALALTVLITKKPAPVIPHNGGTPSPSPSAVTLTGASSYSDIFKRLSVLREKQEQAYAITDNESTVFTYAAGANTNGGVGKSATAYSAFETQTTAPADSDGSGAGAESAVANDDATGAKADYSETTSQVEGVAEADIVKTDGKYIYALTDNYVRVISADRGQMRLVQTLSLPDDENRNYSEMYLSGNRLVVTSVCYENSNVGAGEKTAYYAYDMLHMPVCSTELQIFDVSDPAAIKTVGNCSQSGEYRSSRMIDGTVYVVSNFSVVLNGIDESKPETFVPTVSDNGGESAVEPSCVMSYKEDLDRAVYVTVCAYDAADAEILSTRSLLGGADEIYCSLDNLLTASHRWVDGDNQSTCTLVSRFSLNDGSIEYAATGRVEGHPVNQFAMDEHKGYFRFVTTVDSYETVNGDDGASQSVGYRPSSGAALYVLNGDMKTVGSIEGLAEGERVYSVRFMGDTAYFVTFRQTDPLFSADLSDPTAPRIIGELKIPGFSEYLYPYGDGQLLGIGYDADDKTGRTRDVKLSMFDISDPSDVSESNKNIIEGAFTSDALYNHKACIVNPEKNLIGFDVFDRESNNSEINRYLVYSFADGFRLKAKIGISLNSGPVRGLFIGNFFYIVSRTDVRSFNLGDFSAVGELKF